MPSDLKRFYNRQIVEEIGRDLQHAYPAFNYQAFVAECLSGLSRLELKARAWHIAEAMRHHLPAEYPQAAKVLLRSLPPADTPRHETGGSMDAFRYLPHVLFVSKYGLDDFEVSMNAQHELTKRFTAEFSVRAFFEKYPAATHGRFVEWARAPSVHGRRLVSEGSRPRLPWAPRLRAFQEDPAPVLVLLELLKDDPELYVRRSVANNLNDIAKDHPDVVIATCQRWAKDTKGIGPDSELNRRQIIRHALRSLVKQGHPGALAVLGFDAAPKVRVENPKLTPKVVKIDEALHFSFDLASTVAKQQTRMVDYAVHFIKANGTTAPKVFKLSPVTLPAGGTAHLRGSVSFRQMTTRKHYPGPHRLELSINGVSFPLGSIKLIPK